MSGMGLGGFIDNDPSGGRRGNWLKSWKKKGEIVVWLHTWTDGVKPIVHGWNHTLPVLDEVEDRQTGAKELKLKFPRFVSTEPDKVLARQHFRDKQTDELEIPFTSDPILILREWIRARAQGRGGPQIDLDAPVLEWVSPDDNEVITWRVGTISKLVKPKRNAWNHNLDAKLEYVMVVLVNSDIGSGLQITRETKLLGDRLREEIKNQIESRGEQEGDPTITPYAFKWKYIDDAPSPMDSYKVLRFDKADYTQEIFELIGNTEPPDIAQYVRVNPSDEQKIRDALEGAQQMALPIEELFSGDPRVLADLQKGIGGPSGAVSMAPATSRGAAAPRVPTGTGGERPAARRQVETPAKAAQPPAKPAQAAPPSATPGRRLKAPPPAVEVQRQPTPEMISCDACGELMHPTAPKCGSCGAEYEVDAEPVQQEPARPAAAPPAKPAAAPPATPAKPSQARGAAAPPARGAAPPSASRAPAKPAADDDAPPSVFNCISCQGPVDDTTFVCVKCGLQNANPDEDDIPF